jgi:hypothetical protein
MLSCVKIFTRFVKCLPAERIWPGQKCDACQRYRFDCSKGLSAGEEKAEDAAKEHRGRGGQCQILSPAPSDHGGDSHPFGESAIVQPGDGFGAGRLGASGGHPTVQGAIQRLGVLTGQIGPGSSPAFSLSTRQLSRTSRATELTMPLEEIFLRVWANPYTYSGICSLRLGTTAVEMSTNCRRLAESVC